MRSRDKIDRVRGLWEAGRRWRPWLKGGRKKIDRVRGLWESGRR